MKLITEKTGTKRRIISYGYDLKDIPEYLTVEGNFNMAGKRKSECWYIPATNTVEPKTESEITAEKVVADAERKQNDAMRKLVKIILESNTLADIKTKVQTAVDEGRKV